MKKILFIAFLLVSTLCFSQNWNDHIISEFCEGIPENMMKVDIDNDGDLDVVVNDFCNSTWAIFFYENLNNGYFSTRKEIESFVGLENYTLGYLTNDTLPDIIIGSSSILRWTKNLGNDVFDSQGIIDNNVSFPSRIQIADIDGDNLNDIFLFTNSNEAIWYKNLGNNTFNSGQVLIDSIYISDNVTINDFDLDGDLDFVYRNSENTKEFILARNNGFGQYTKQSLYTVNDNSPNPIYFISEDINFDSFPDLIISIDGNNERIIKLVNNSGMDISPPTVIGNFPHGKIKLFDVDNDNIKDIVAYDGANFKWIKGDINGSFSNGSSLFWELNNIVQLNNAFGEFMVDDFNSDGYSDFLISNTQLGISFFPGNINTNFPNQRSISMEWNWETSQESTIHIKDFNLTGSNQILSSAKLYSSSNNPYNLYNEHTNIGSLTTSKEVLSDFDNDGIEDYLFYESNYIKMYKGLNNGGFSNTPQSITSFIYPLSYSYFSVVDFNGDGFKDIVFSHISDDLVEVFLNDGSNNNLSISNSFDLGGTLQLTHFYDINNDGRTDILYHNGTNPHSYTVKYNQGNNMYVDSIFNYSANDNIAPSSITLEDVNNDSYIDIIVTSFNNYQKLILYQNNSGSIDFSNPIIFNMEEYELSYLDRIYLHDLNGDNIKDLIYLGSIYGSNNYPIRYRLGNGNFSFDTIYTEITDNTIFNFNSGGIRCIGFGDMDSDGDIDIIGASGATNKLEWHENPFLHPYQISGKVFFDLINNGIYDVGEPGLDQSYIDAQPLNTYTYTFPNGDYVVNPDYAGNFVISNSFANNPDWSLTSDSTSYSAMLTDSLRVKRKLDFGYRPTNDIYGVEPNIVSAPTRCSFIIKQWVNIRNIGSLYTDGQLQYKLDTLCSFVSAELPVDSFSQDSSILYWNFSNIFFNELRTFEIEIEMPDVSHLGNTLTFVSTCTGLDTLNNMSYNNIDTLFSVLNCAYDPNDKLCFPLATDSSNRIPFNTSYLDYTIRFQNTGTDTAFNIVLLDTLDTNLDITTLRVLSYSHPQSTSIDVGSREVSFNFNNILLPDSNVNESNSHGYIKFRIYVDDNVEFNDSIKNTAYIYFDFNPPIVTNDEIRVLGLVNCDISTSSTIQACDSFYYKDIWYYDSTTILDSLQTSNGCDSIITIDLTIHPATNGSITEESTTDYNSPSGDYTWTVSGTYTDVIENSNGCDSVITVYLTILDDDTTGIHSLAEGIVKIYPNPASDAIYIELKDMTADYQNMQVYLLDINGKQVAMQSIFTDKISINTENIADGTYFIQIGDKNQILLNEKVVVVK